MRFTRGILVLVAALASLISQRNDAVAEGYPAKPISYIIGFAPGGPSDVMSRILTDRMAEILKQPFVIENRAGAGGGIAAQAVARAAPDGYTVLLATNGMFAINPHVYKTLGYDAEKDFEPIGIIGMQPNVLFVHPSLEVKTLADFIAYAKANPGKLNYGTGGVGTSSHLAGELLKMEAKIDMVHVAHRGTGLVIQAVVGNHIQVGMNPPAPLISLIQAGQIRPLAVSSLKRTEALPDVPTVAELGFPGFEATVWHGIVAPAGTPKEIISTLSNAMIEALKDTKIRKQMTDLGIDVVASTPDQIRAAIKADIPKWAGVAQAAGLKREQ